MEMDLGSSNNSNFERSVDNDSRHFFSKYNKFPTLKILCIVSLVFVTVAAGVSIIFTIRWAMALPEMEAKLHHYPDEKQQSYTTLTTNVSLLLNNLKTNNEIEISVIEANLNQHLDKTHQSYRNLYTNLSLLLNELKENKDPACSPSGNVDVQKQSYSKLCHKVFAGPKSTWYEAKGICQYLGGFLAELPDADTDKHVKKIATIDGGSDYWLGANDINNETDWRWSKYNKRLVFQDWHPSRQTYIHVDGDKNCLELFRWSSEHKYFWNDSHCNRHQGYICQKYADNCGEGWSSM